MKSWRLGLPCLCITAPGELSWHNPYPNPTCWAHLGLWLTETCLGQIFRASSNFSRPAIPARPWLCVQVRNIPLQRAHGTKPEPRPHSVRLTLSTPLHRQRLHFLLRHHHILSPAPSSPAPPATPTARPPFQKPTNSSVVFSIRDPQTCHSPLFPGARPSPSAAARSASSLPPPRRLPRPLRRLLLRLPRVSPASAPPPALSSPNMPRPSRAPSAASVAAPAS